MALNCSFLQVCNALKIEKIIFILSDMNNSSLTVSCGTPWQNPALAKVTVNMAWLRLEVSFMAVAAVVRARLPNSMRALMES